MDDETALRIGRELLLYADPEHPNGWTDDLTASFGRIAVNLCTPVVLEGIREPTPAQIEAGMKEAAVDLASEYRAMIDELREDL